MLVSVMLLSSGFLIFPFLFALFSLRFKFRIVTRRLMITVIGIVVHLFLPQVQSARSREDQREPRDAYNGLIQGVSIHYSGTFFLQ